MNDRTRHSGGAHAMRRAVDAVRSHPWVTVTLLVIAGVALALSAFIGLPLVVTIGLLAMVGLGAIGLWTLWARRRPDGDAGRRAAAGRAGLVAVAISGVATFAVIQLVPYGRAHSNPPVTGEPRWADARTRELVVDACYSCHSNEVEYPPYASVAPISWMVQRHVDEGREKVNYSEFSTDPGEAEESLEVVEEGEMPPGYFTRFGLHPEANLSDAEEAELIDGLRRTPGLAGD